ncbi:MAG: hypothetical protein IPK65_03685 [Gammaproteobacteria bacterium]|nr:hypothetical protein [Gammaproteobacteria bacterium]
MSILLENLDLSYKYPPVHLRSSRLFYVDPMAEDPAFGWYFKVRGPRCFGPFQSKEEAGQALDLIVNRYLELNDSSGRQR